MAEDAIRQGHEQTTAVESATLATSLRAHQSSTGFSFTGLTVKEASPAITLAVTQWAKTFGWSIREEASIRCIDLPRMLNRGCRVVWSPPWSAHLDLRLTREDGLSITVEIDPEDTGLKAALEAAQRISALFLSAGPCRLRRTPGEAEVQLIVHADVSRDPGEGGYLAPDAAEEAGAFLR